MEKICEFCMALRPAVYCKADAAHLCLACDAKVHSANALSNRHPRTLVCESCKYGPAYVRCSDHQMFMCRGCNSSLHKDSSQHQKQLISSYMGCPSAKDFATLWGFDLNELDNSTLQDQVASNSCVSVDTGVMNLDIPRQSCPQTSEVKSMSSGFSAGSEVGSSNQHYKVYYRGKQQENICFILQQILDLKRLQLTEGNNDTSLICGQQQTDISSSKYISSWKLDKNLDQHLQHSLDLGTDLQPMGSPHQELNEEPFPLPFSQLEQLPSSSAVGNPLQGDPFWQFKNPVQSDQVWSQNMQDLGVCEELSCSDNFDIPDVDLTFRNFEELFGGDQDPTRALLDDEDITCSSLEKDASIDRSDDGYAKAIEETSVASSVYINQSGHIDKDVGSSDQCHHFSRSAVCPRTIRPSYSTLSFSVSRLSAESSGTTDYMDTGLSTIVAGLGNHCNSPDPVSAQVEAKENAMMRYKEKKKVRR
ncbi:hypothetical protein F0562_034102 [Nyssa sinensis]|uniref:B box-type domain-containing protein n=1 Tax=Nyssa sinensis TaxID=561372 RepID=A0A5J5AFX5_9ASTE|nr:hypothetical protein F0562_034102 [Nyssa sinensis]